jgi:hypothetical protein
MTSAVDVRTHATSPAPMDGTVDNSSIFSVLNVYSFIHKRVYKLFIHPALKLRSGQLFKNQRLTGQKRSHQPRVSAKSEKRSKNLMCKKKIGGRFSL